MTKSPINATTIPNIMPTLNGKSEKLNIVFVEKLSNDLNVYLLLPASLAAALNSTVVALNPTDCTYPLN